jgi:hypothetical protein
MPIFGLPQMLRGIDYIGMWSHCSGEGVNQQGGWWSLTNWEGPSVHSLEEKLDYPANLEESVRKKAVKAAISQIGTLQRRFKAHLRKKYASEEETPFVKHAFLQKQD